MKFLSLKILEIKGINFLGIQKIKIMEIILCKKLIF